MTRVVWTSPARQDVREIRVYIARDSAYHARLVAGQLARAVDRLQDFPLSGRVVPELAQPTLRELIEGMYRIVYRVTTAEVQILAVVTAHASSRRRSSSAGRRLMVRYIVTFGAGAPLHVKRYVTPRRTFPTSAGRKHTRQVPPAWRTLG